MSNKLWCDYLQRMLVTGVCVLCILILDLYVIISVMRFCWFLLIILTWIKSIVMFLVAIYFILDLRNMSSSLSQSVDSGFEQKFSMLSLIQLLLICWCWSANIDLNWQVFCLSSIYSLSVVMHTNVLLCVGIIESFWYIMLHGLIICSSGSYDVDGICFF